MRKGKSAMINSMVNRKKNKTWMILRNYMMI